MRGQPGDGALIFFAKTDVCDDIEDRALQTLPAVHDTGSSSTAGFRAYAACD